MKDNNAMNKFLSHPRVKNLGVKKESLVDIINLYESIIVDDLLENGHIELDNGMIIEVVRLINRVHVLRGVPYESSRKYKLKLTMEDVLYKKIEEYYDRLKEDIQ